MHDPERPDPSGPYTPRERLLRALLHDHSGFVQDRLDSFVGRAAELAEVQRRVAELLPSGGYLTITGQAGQGKSSLIARLLELHLRQSLAAAGLPEPAQPPRVAQLLAAAGDQAPAFHFIPFQPGPDHQVGLLQNLLARLALKHGLPELYVAGHSRAALRDAFARALELTAARGAQELIFIDGLDQIEEDASGLRDLSFLPTRPPAGIVFVLGSRPNDTLQPLELRKPHQQYWLPPLSRPDFDLLLRRRQAALTPDQADRFYAAMEASPLYLDLAARELAGQGALPPAQIIARSADDPDNLFALAVARLERPPELWRAAIRPLLGLLLAAQEPLRPDTLAALLGQEHDLLRTALARAGGLLARDGQGRATLFHLKLRDFLREDPARPARPHVFSAGEERGYHQRLADWCAQGGAAIWQDSADPREQARRTYARQHAVTHLCRAHSWAQLWELLDRGEYGRAKLRHDPSTRSFALDLDTVRQAVAAASVADPAHSAAWLVRLWTYSLLRCSLSSQADRYPRGLIELLARLGREQEAVGLAEVLSDPQHRAALLVKIGALLGQRGRRAEEQQLFARAREIARGLGEAGLGTDRLLGSRGLMDLAEQLFGLQRFDEAADLASELAETAWSLEDANARGTMLEAIIKMLVGAGRMETLAALGHQASERGESSWAAQLGGAAVELAHSQQTDTALLLARTIEDSLVRTNVFQISAEVLLAAGRPDQAAAVAREAAEAARAIAPADRRAAALSKLARMLVDSGHADEAAPLARQAAAAAGGAPGTWDLSSALQETVQVLIDIGHADEASALARWFAQVARPYRRGPFLPHYGARLLARAGHPDEAAALVELSAEPEEQVEALQAVALALAAAGRADEANRAADQLTAVARGIENPWGRSRMLWVGAQLLAQLRRPDEALALAQQAAQISIDLVEDSSRHEFLRAIVLGLSALGRQDEAVALAQSARKERAMLLTWLAPELPLAWGVDRTLALIQAALPEREQIDALGHVARALTRRGRADLALALARALTQEPARQRILNTVLQSLAHDQQFDAALALAQTFPEPGQRAGALLSIIGALVRFGRTDEAPALALEAAGLVQSVRDPEVLLAIAELLADGPHAELARGLAQRVVETSRSTPETHSWSSGLHMLAQRLAQADLLAEAALLAGTIVDDFALVLVLQDLAVALARSGRVAEAVALAAAILDERQRPAALQTLAGPLADGPLDRAVGHIYHEARAEALGGAAAGLVRLGHTEAGLALARQAVASAQALGAPWPESVVIEEVAQALLGAGRIDEAADLVQSSPNQQLLAQTLQAVARALAQAGRADEALRLARQTAATIESDLDEWQSASLLAGTAQLLVGAGQIEEALTLLDRPLGRGPRDQLAQGIVVALSVAGHTERARALMESSLSRYYHDDAYAATAQALAQAGRLEEAQAIIQDLVVTSAHLQTILEIGRRLAAAGRADEALALARRTAVRIREVADEIQHPRIEAEMLQQAAAMLLAGGCPDEALSALEQAIAAMQQAEEPDGLGEIMLDSARIYAALQDWQALERRVSEALVVTQTIDHNRQVWEDSATLLASLPPQPPLLAIVGRLWSRESSREVLCALLHAAAPFFVSNPAQLLPLLESEAWVREQLRW